MIQVGLSVRTLGAPAATDSSPMKLQTPQKPNRWVNIAAISYRIKKNEKQCEIYQDLDQDLHPPVSRKLLFNGGYNELLHSLVRLGHQVDRRAFLHDADVFLEGLTDHLAETRCFHSSLHLVLYWALTHHVSTGNRLYFWQQ